MVSVPTMADALGAVSSGRVGMGVPTETCLSCVGTMPHAVVKGESM